jgi:hypothetical protein
VVEDAIALVQSVAADLVAASGSGAGIDFSAAQSSLSAADAGTLGTSDYGGALSAVSAAVGAAGVAFVDADASMGAAGLGSASALAAAGQGAGALAQAGFARAYALRAQVNLANAAS